MDLFCFCDGREKGLLFRENWKLWCGTQWLASMEEKAQAFGWLALFFFSVLNFELPDSQISWKWSQLKELKLSGFLDFKSFLCFGHSDGRLSYPDHSRDHPKLEDSPASLFLLMDEPLRIGSFLESMLLHSLLFVVVLTSGPVQRNTRVSPLLLSIELQRKTLASCSSISFEIKEA